MENKEYAQLGLQSTNDLNDMLFYQAEALWPQESKFFEDYVQKYESTNQIVKILDVAAGTGEFVIRLAKKFKNSQIVGIELENGNVDAANKRIAKESLENRIKFQQGDIFNLKDIADSSFDIVSCRSALHAIQNPKNAISELYRVTKKNGGILHLLNEDYGMLYSSPIDSETLWKACQQYFIKDNANPFMGRSSYPIVHEVIPNASINLQYVFADTVKCSKEEISKIFKSWRNGYSGAIAKANGISKETVDKWFNELIECTESENGYSCWQNVVCIVKV